MKSRAAKTLLLATTMQQLRMRVTAIMPKRITTAIGNCLNDADQDGICDEYEVPGCTRQSACNYNAAATEADGSCTFAEAGYDCDGNCLIDLDNDGICDLTQTVGCLDSSACNYDATATEAGYCDYPETNYDCDGNCLNDSDQDGICNEFEVAGCTDSSACNYDSSATDDDASCTYATAGSIAMATVWLIQTRPDLRPR